MKKMLKVLAALFLLAAGCSAARTHSAQDSAQDKAPADQSAKGAEVMKGLRHKLLTSRPEEIGLKGEDAEAKVWGVLMDAGMPAGVATLVSLRDGTSSLYTNTGGGVLGGYTARDEAKAFVAEAEKALAHMSVTQSFDYPAAGRARFYVLTRDGVFTAEATPDEMLEPGHALSPLFRAANEVLTRLRLATEKRMNENKP